VTERSIEANKLNADLVAGRLMEQVLHQSRQAYLFAPSTYTYEALNAAQRLKRQLYQLLLRPVAGEDAGRSSSVPSPQQDTLL
jgi:hypothetical protein